MPAMDAVGGGLSSVTHGETRVKLSYFHVAVLAFPFRFADIALFTIVVGSNVIVHPFYFSCRDFRDQPSIQCQSS